ncbi:hypothetical protein [Brochothrix thermosphacta]|uniref:hypothetical protein n=1 Tax=Brochothrix thermosphacta TaxID=2756 RepID=UPI00083F9957|nr:hypothetical protein [Brochothrix thermosphacta]ODJ64891.1 hypothetical protein BFR36_09695 [Brochothrix thermosphacta]SOC32663.1 conserved protein of unknown function [Brochothrix thermosphacta]
MQEQTISELVKWFIGLLLIFGMVSIALFLYQFQDINTYKQQINYQIEREGGLTKDAVKSLKKESEDNYNGRYTIKSEKLNEKVPFGEKVDYTVVSKITVYLFEIPDMTIEQSGSGVSQVR